LRENASFIFLARFPRRTGTTSAGNALEPIEPKVRAAGEFARGAELDQPIEQAAGGAIG
jgi:hypothetical protein